MVCHLRSARRLNSVLSFSDRRFVIYWASTLLPEMSVLKRNHVPNPSPDAVDPSKITKLLGQLASLDDSLDDSIDESC